MTKSRLYEKVEVKGKGSVGKLYTAFIQTSAAETGEETLARVETKRLAWLLYI